MMLTSFYSTIADLSVKQGLSGCLSLYLCVSVCLCVCVCLYVLLSLLLLLMALMQGPTLVC